MSKITHEQAREGLLQVYIYNDIHTYVLVRDYITQQEELEQHSCDVKVLSKQLEKQEKILLLYKAKCYHLTMYNFRTDIDQQKILNEISLINIELGELENDNDN